MSTNLTDSKSTEQETKAKTTEKPKTYEVLMKFNTGTENFFPKDHPDRPAQAEEFTSDKSNFTQIAYLLADGYIREAK